MQINVFQMDNWKELLLKLTVKKEKNNNKKPEKCSAGA